MAFTKSTDQLDNISQLPTLPNAVGGLSASQLQVLFDKAALDLQTYINETLIPELESYALGSSGAGNIGFDPTNATGVTSTDVQGALEEVVTIAQQAQAGTIADGAITTAKLASSAVTTAKLNDSAVTTAKLASKAVTAANTDFDSHSDTLHIGSRVYMFNSAAGTNPDIATENGTIVLSSSLFGTTLPTSTAKGRLFFKKV